MKDMYFHKMGPALASAGITNTMGSRRDWPMQVRHSVFQELLSETPKWLISKEISFPSLSSLFVIVCFIII